MEHVKKMVLVPAESADRLHQKSVNPTPSDVMHSLDREMSAILKNKEHDAREKWHQYQQTLQRYMHFANESRKPISYQITEEVIPATIPPVDGDGEGERRVDHDHVRDMLLSSMPTSMKNSARTLYDHLAKRGEKSINWNDKGVVILNGSPLPNSNIVDLVDCMVRPRKTFNPPGVEQFASALADLNLPTSFIANTRYRNFILKRKVEETTPGKDAATTPVTTGSPSIRKKRFASSSTPRRPPKTWRLWLPS